MIDHFGINVSDMDTASRFYDKVLATLKNGSLPSPWTGSGALNHADSVAVAIFASGVKVVYPQTKNKTSR